MEEIIKPLGRRADGPSPVIAAEVAVLKAYGKDMAAVKSGDAKGFRTVLMKHADPELRKRFACVFRGVGLSWE